MTDVFSPTRTAALERLAAFLPGAGRAYAARRNFDLGPGRHAHVSCLSPYLRCRLITEEEVIQVVLGRHSLTAAEKFVQEVFWRTYWKGWLELRPGVWDQYQAGLIRAWDKVQTQAGLRAEWEASCKGETDIECFNVWAQELVQTGYLHNHARMWFASIWVFTLKLPWELGADFFLRHLLDGDPASNTLSWRWVAGLQTQGKTYLARASNISKFTEGRYHPKWQLAPEAPPLDPLPVPASRVLPADTRGNPDLRTGILLHEEDLIPGFVCAGLQPVVCALLAPQSKVGPLVTSDRVTAFRGAALEDASSRWADKLGPRTRVQDAREIAAWAKENALEQIVTPYAPTGPVSAVLAQVTLNPQAPKLHQVMRAYDRMTWPHATKGFFAFKKNIPDFAFNLSGKTAA